MTAITEELHRAFLRPLGDAVLRHSPAGDKRLFAELLHWLGLCRRCRGGRHVWVPSKSFGVNHHVQVRPWR